VLIFPKSPPKFSVSRVMTSVQHRSPAGAAAVPLLVASVSFGPNSDGPGAVDDGALGTDSSGFFPNKPPPKRLPVGAVPPDERFSAGFGTEPKSPPVLGPNYQRQLTIRLRRRGLPLTGDLCRRTCRRFRKNWQKSISNIDKKNISLQSYTYNPRSLVWIHQHLPVRQA
jgi:hypothetical protein